MLVIVLLVLAMIFAIGIKGKVDDKSDYKNIRRNMVDENPTISCKAIPSGYTPKHILCFDTETNGLKADARIAQLAWILYDVESSSIISKHSMYVIPDGWSMPRSASDVNGLTTPFLKKNGKNLNEVMSAFYEDLKKCDVIVGHNLMFDVPKIGYEFARCGMTSNIYTFNKLYKYDTMTDRDDPTRIKLGVLYTQLFGKKFDNAHDALADTTATLCCALKLMDISFDMNTMISSEPKKSKRITKCKDSELIGKTICITGEFVGTRSILEDYFTKRFGCEVKAGMSKKVDYLIAGENPGGTKMDKAIELGTPIINKVDFKKYKIEESI